MAEGGADSSSFGIGQGKYLMQFSGTKSGQSEINFRPNNHTVKENYMVHDVNQTFPVISTPRPDKMEISNSHGISGLGILVEELGRKIGESEWVNMMQLYLQKRNVIIPDQADEIISHLMGRARDVVKVSLRSNPTMPLADFYSTLPRHGENPVDYWLCLNKAADTSMERQVPPSQYQKLCVALNEMEERGIICKSISEFASPLVLCWKKNANLPICTDFRWLNAGTVKDAHPLPHPEDYLAALCEEGVSTDPGKVKAIAQITSVDLMCPDGVTPGVKKARGMGCRGVPISKKITPDDWSPACEEALSALKEALLSNVVLAHLDFSRPCILATHASSQGLGAVLSQMSPGENRICVCKRVTVQSASQISSTPP
ncbi:Transposon Tf2-11 polyprotein [Labeo rohita]|uniref:Transposon Tf2-11 polyprotein n=1 Tax=Labeo rohita TaxID=84645 RepID=A0ABQ8L8F8_LABRO|nr:Transposon Tf2-11 polyprotein [Labeo rohita]